MASRSESALSMGLPLMATAEAEVCSAPEREVMELFDQFNERLAGYILSFGVSKHDAEDIVQETFFALFCHLRMERSRENLRGWLFRVAHNLALKRRTSNRRYESEADHAIEPLDPQPSAEEQVLFSQRRSRLLAVVEALPEQDQRCLYLRAEGLKYREIAQVLGISLGSVAQSLARSVGRLTRSEAR
jgi:RNA polymerase sigma-70 factor, ECF subfamily